MRAANDPNAKSRTSFTTSAEKSPSRTGESASFDKLLEVLGREPTLMEWLNLNFLGEIPEPLDGETLAAIPESLKSQVAELPSRYRYSD
jgi:hypothetical protein